MVMGVGRLACVARALRQMSSLRMRARVRALFEFAGFKQTLETCLQAGL